jgi:Arc/MetJ family transcription regulator
MATNLAIDPVLLKEAQKVGGHKTKKEAVNEALREYVTRHQQGRILELAGTIEYEEGYDYKQHRSQAPTRRTVSA